MRKILIAALAALVALAAVAVANAQDEGAGAELTAKVTPTNAGTKRKPKPAKVAVEIDNGDSTQTADRLRIFLPDQIKVSGRGLTKCSQQDLSTVDPDNCPSASRLGVGTADAVAGVNTSNPAELKFNVTGFLRSNSSVGFMINQQGGDINALAIGTFKNASGRYGKVLDVPIPQIAREFPEGNFNGLDRLEVSLYRKKGKRSLFKSTGCKQRRLPFKGEISFQPNPDPPTTEKVTALESAPCTK